MALFALVLLVLSVSYVVLKFSIGVAIVAAIGLVLGVLVGDKDSRSRTLIGVSGIILMAVGALKLSVLLGALGVLLSIFVAFQIMTRNYDGDGFFKMLGEIVEALLD